MSLWIAPAAVLAVFWLWFLARGKAPGGVKRLAFRATLLAALVGLLVLASSRGVFARASTGFQLVLILALFAVELGYLYTTRFCPRCGTMVRNLKLAECPRCAHRASLERNRGGRRNHPERFLCARQKTGARADRAFRSRPVSVQAECPGRGHPDFPGA